MERNIFLQLLDKYLKGTANDAEKQLVEEYYEQLLKQDSPDDDNSNSEELKKKLLENILANVEAHTIPLSSTHKRPLFYITRIAAAIVIIFAGIFVYKSVTNPKTATEVIAAKVRPDSLLLPGTDKAVLTLADGSVINLDSSNNGKLADQNGSVVTQKGGHILYDGNENNPGKIVYNTLSTPRGGQYNVTLGDGTRVWLNALSGIRYPVNFSGASRTVEIIGEVYFEVAHDKRKPFIVKANDMSVEVLGTHFNVMSYADEDYINTTLLEGLVKVSNEKDSKTLQPGQQSAYNNSSKVFNVRDADTEKVMAWKNGMFLFKGDDIKTIMRQMSRWYDVDVTFSGTVSTKLYRGSISKYVTAQDVFKILELAGIQFKIEGKKVIIL